MLNFLVFGGIAIVALAIMITMYILGLRRIVPTNEVHIVQRTKDTVSYGKDSTDKMGNTYYQIPAWVPKYGVVVSKLPTTVIDIEIPNYEAYDKDRLPFVVDIRAFFRICDFNKAAGRVFTVNELRTQLDAIVKGAARSILAKEDLESIMSERNKYGDMFTEMVTTHLKEWGVAVVKNIELMDIRDSKDSQVIANIMQKKESQIEMERRTAVAENLRKAQEAEIAAKQEIELKQQDAERKVGLRQAEVQKEVGIANEQQKQEVQAQAKITAEKEMEVKQVRDVQTAEIEKQAATVRAEQEKAVIEVNAKAVVTKAEADKNVTVLNAEASKEQQILRAQADQQQQILQAKATKETIELKADADLKAATNEAKGIEAKGKASAEAERLQNLAQVAGQIELSEKIGENKEYQDFVVRQRQVEAMEAIGVEQAKNLSGAEIKIFANAGSVADGVNQAGKVLSPKTGMDFGSMLETIKSIPAGSELIDAVTTKLKGDK